MVTSLLADGGFLYLTEFHPFTWVFADDDLTVELDYFHDPEGIPFEDGGGSYADLERPTRNNATREWAHPIADVLSAVLGAGLRLELFHEHDYTLFPRFAAPRADTETLGAGALPPACGFAAAAADVLARARAASQPGRSGLDPRRWMHALAIAEATSGRSARSRQLRERAH